MSPRGERTRRRSLSSPPTGGRPYTGELTRLLVDLVDAAVGHQAAALSNDAVVAVTLEQLRERHEAGAAGHDEVAEW